MLLSKLLGILGCCLSLAGCQPSGESAVRSEESAESERQLSADQTKSIQSLAERALKLMEEADSVRKRQAELLARREALVNRLVALELGREVAETSAPSEGTSSESSTGGLPSDPELVKAELKKTAEKITLLQKRLAAISREQVALSTEAASEIQRAKSKESAELNEKENER